jgi:hypothetical protein
MIPDALHHRYFRAKDGHWRGRIRFRLTDPRGLRASSLSLADKWSLRCMSLASHLSALTLKTSVECRGDDVLHTTRVTNLGVLIYRSAETIVLEDDGRSFRVEGREGFFPFLRGADWNGQGAVADDHDGAVYQLPCFGLVMEQKTRMTAAGLETVQRTPFTRADILLKWQRPLRGAPSSP